MEQITPCLLSENQDGCGRGRCYKRKIMSVNIPSTPGAAWSLTASNININIIVEFCQGWGSCFWQKILLFPAAWRGSVIKLFFINYPWLNKRSWGSLVCRDKWDWSHMNMLRKKRTKHKKSTSSEVCFFFFFQSSVKSVLAHTGVIFFGDFFSCRLYWATNFLISIKLSGITLQLIPGLRKARQALIL